ncbi:MAG: hypothetical protein JXB10_03890 [Pirellulales bacterium]|nr:hypothetical protein [Pirellulales bacterium]
MWCRLCQQDVPAITTPGESKYCCPRCGQDLFADDKKRPTTNDQQPTIPETTADSFGERFDFDTWEMDEQLRHIERVLQFEKSLAERRKATSHRRAARRDPAHAGSPPKYLSGAAASSPRNQTPVPSSQAAGGLLGTIFLVLAGALLVCGGALLGVAAWGGRPELAHFGLPIVLGGQLCLLAGLLLQLDRLPHRRRAPAEEVAAADQKPQRPQARTTTVESAHDRQELLGDLESQLARLARKIGRHEDSSADY